MNLHQITLIPCFRGSIMFGQPLGEATCRELLRDLAACAAPWQCAHGRPSVHVMCSLDTARRNTAQGRRKVFTSLL